MQCSSQNTLGFPIFIRGVDHLITRYNRGAALQHQEFHLAPTPIKDGRYTSFTFVKFGTVLSCNSKMISYNLSTISSLYFTSYSGIL